MLSSLGRFQWAEGGFGFSGKRGERDRLQRSQNRRDPRNELGNSHSHKTYELICHGKTLSGKMLENITGCLIVCEKPVPPHQDAENMKF